MGVVSPAKPTKKRWTPDEYFQLAEAGFFRDQHVELIDGEILLMPPMLEPHATGIEKSRRALEKAFGAGYWLRVQMPLRIGPRSAPEPDVAVVAGDPGDFATAPPTALLVVEVSDATLAFDRSRKAATYARGGILVYWIVNIRDRRLEIRRSPVADGGPRRQFRYADLQVLEPTDGATPLAAPRARIAVADLLP